MNSNSLRKLQDCKLDPGASLREAMLALESNATGIVLFTDFDGRLLGTLTDGDIRRALLAGAPLDAGAATFMERHFIQVLPEADRPAVLDLMRARGIEQIPVVDSAGRVQGIHLLREMLRAAARPNWAVIMAGGEGKRLRPLTASLPKPMLRVAGRPILERLVLQLVGCGIQKIYLSINYLGHIVEQHFRDGEAFGCVIEYLRETEPLGTGGALGLLPQPAAEPLLVMNGDLVTQANLGAILDYHAAGGQSATLGVRRYLHTIPFGCVELDGMQLTNFEEKPCITRFVNSGIYVFNPGVLADIPAGVACSAPDLVMQARHRGGGVRCFEISDEWLDVGRVEQLQLAVYGN